jgi:hypothetical protein
MTYAEIIQKVSEDTGIPTEIVDKAYKAFWLYIRNSVQELPLKEELTEAEFLGLRPNFNIPSLGKLTCTYQRYLGVKEKFNHIRKLRRNEEPKED